MTTATIDRVVLAYRTLRDQKKEMQDRHKEELKPLDDKMEILENHLHQQLLASGVESMKTENGTVYRTNLSSVKVGDWEVALEFIKSNNLWHMLEKRLAKAAVEEFVTGQGHNVPGTEITYVQKVNVRK